jgi:hypothetical protein
MQKNEIELKQKTENIEKKLNKNVTRYYEEKNEKVKSKAIQNELELLSAQTRISRIQSKFVR